MAEEKKLKLTLICYPQDNNCYTVICPELDLTTQGDTVEDAKFMMNDLVKDYFVYFNKNNYTKQDLIDIYNKGDKVIIEMSV